MSVTETSNIETTTSLSWLEANQAYLDNQLKRLRLRLQRKVLWLRNQWKHDPLQEYQGLVVSDAQADWLLSGEDPDAEAYFYRTNEQAKNLTKAIDSWEQQINEQVQALSESGQPPALHMLGHLFDLSPLEREVLLFCLGPQLDQSFERLYAYVQDDVTRKYPTAHLLVTLAGGQFAEEVHDCLLETAPLRRNALVSMVQGVQLPTNPYTCPLHIDERISAYLRGIDYVDKSVQKVLSPITSSLLAEPQREFVQQLAGWSEVRARRGQWPAINLVSPVNAGQETIAAVTYQQLGFRLQRLNIERLPASDTERQVMFAMLGREAVLSQLAYYIDLNGLGQHSKETLDQITTSLENTNAWFIIGSRERWQSSRDLLTVHVPPLGAEARKTVWRELVDEKTIHDADLNVIVQQFEFEPKTIERVVAEARERARLHSPKKKSAMTTNDLWQTCRDHMAAQMDGLAQRIVPAATWDDIVLPRDTLRQLKEIAAQVQHRHQVYEDWQLGQRLARGRGIIALFAGPSGTGKTMAAEVLANEMLNNDLDLDLYRIDLASVVSKYIGDTEKNIRKVFDAAEQSGAILFFDEADALFGKRTEVKDSHDRYANLEVSYLLQRMEDYRGLAILATNRKYDLDRAFLRRLRFSVDFPFPDANSRAKIWQKMYPEQTPKNELDYKALSRLEIAGGNIKTISINAAFMAASANEPISMKHTIRAGKREYVKIEKSINENEFGPWYTEVMRE